jgi:hypothetical protein
LDEARVALGVPAGDVPWQPRGRRRLVTTALIGAVVALAQIVALLVVPAALAWWTLRGRARTNRRVSP